MSIDTKTGSVTTSAVGMIGIGLLGSALAERLLAAGFAVLGYDTDPARCGAIEKLGGTAAPSADEVARCRRIVLSLPDSDVVADVLGRIESQLQPGTILLDTTTGDPDAEAALGARMAARGVHYLDIPVAGSSTQARAGQALILAAGEQAICQQCADLLGALAERWFYIGPCGSGARMKLVVNLVLGLQRAALGEGLAFARACGLDAELALDILRIGPTAGRVLDTKGRKMLQEDFTPPEARLAQHLKDVRLILQAGERRAARLPLSTLHRQLLEQLVEQGYAEADNSAIVKAF